MINIDNFLKLSRNLIAVLAGALFLASCNDFLDKEFDENLTIEQIQQNRKLMIGMQTDIYNNMPRSGNGSYNCIDGAMFACASDEAKESRSASEVNLMTNGGWSPSKTVDDQWAFFYTGIRKCHQFLSIVDDSVVDNEEISDKDGKLSDESFLKDRLKAETLFLKAFFYFELIKRYGDVPLVEEVLPVDKDALNYPRTSCLVIADSIANWCDRAAAHLPVIYSDSQKGRATKGAALALKSRLLLYMASPLYNPEGLREKWEAAADAAWAVIQLSTDNKNMYRLTQKYGSLFTTSFPREVILANKYESRRDVELLNVPNGYSQGEGHTNPTQDLVDAYEIKIGNVYVPYDKTNELHEKNMYVDRDPRFALTILYNGADFKGRPVETFVGGQDGLNRTSNHTKTGYYLRKFINEDLDLNEDNSVAKKGWIQFRFGEILLNYAEAKNEALDTPDQSIFTQLNLVRARAGVTSLKMGMSKDELRERIRNERRVELAFEEHRFWDVRRWKLGESVFNAPIHGIRIQKTGVDQYKTERFEVENRIFYPKMYFYPLSVMEVLKAPATGQTTGW